MSDRSLTLLALHLEDASVQIGPKRIDRSAGGEATDQSDQEPDGETAAGRSVSPIVTLVSVIVVLASVAAILGRVRGPDAADGIELEDEIGDED